MAGITPDGDRTQRIAALRRELEVTPDRRFQDEIDSVRISVDVLRDNEAELLRFLSYCEESPENHDLWRMQFIKKKRQLSREAVRLLHNYIASAASLADHTRNAHARLFAEGEFPDYEDKKASDILANGVVQFVRQLRNYQMHVSSPAIVLRSSVDPTTGAGDVRVGLDKVELEKWKNWKPVARQYLGTCEEFIHLCPLVKEYGSRIHSFYTWYDARHWEIHGPEIRGFRERQRELVVLTLEQKIDEWLSALPSSRFLLSDNNLFIGLFDISEIRAIESYPPRSPARVGKALETFQRYFDIPPSLEARIRRVYHMREFYVLGDTSNGGGSSGASTHAGSLDSDLRSS